MDRHEVPTHLDVEDQLFWGLTLPRLFGSITALGAAYGVYARLPWNWLGLEDSALRWAVPAVLAAVGIGLFLLRPSGRSAASWLVDLARFALGPREYLGPVEPEKGESHVP